MQRCVVEGLKGGDRDHNTAELKRVLAAGEESNAKRHTVVLNAGMGLYVYDVASTTEDGVRQAREALNSGKATEKLEQWMHVSNQVLEVDR